MRAGRLRVGARVAALHGAHGLDGARKSPPRTHPRRAHSRPLRPSRRAGRSPAWCRRSPASRRPLSNTSVSACRYSRNSSPSSAPSRPRLSSAVTLGAVEFGAVEEGGGCRCHKNTPVACNAALKIVFQTRICERAGPAGARVADISSVTSSYVAAWARWIAKELEVLGRVAHVHEWGDQTRRRHLRAWMESRHDAADHVLCVVSDRRVPQGAVFHPRAQRRALAGSLEKTGLRAARRR